MNALRSWRSLSFALTIILLMVVGCQNANPPGPTPIPTTTLTVTPSPSPTLEVSAAPQPTLRPIVEATAIVPTEQPVVNVPTATTPPNCYVARQGDTLLGLLFKGGYGASEPGLLAEFRRLNNMPDGSNNIQPGQTYCIPKPTPTPSPPGYEATQTKQCEELGCSGAGTPFSIATYKVVEGDNIVTVQLKTGASLRILCDLNNPSPINCAGCDIDKPIGQQGCRPILRVGDLIRIPGPPPTATITPTLTGSETATPTPGYGEPRIVSPVNGSSQSGTVQLVWLPVGILQPDEQYLVVLKDMTGGKTLEFETQATSYRLPADLQPADGQPHTINWRVTVARKSADGAYVSIGKMSVIYSFTWR